MTQEWPGSFHFVLTVGINGKECGSIDNIASWMNQVLATLAGATSGWNQCVLEILSALDKANKENFSTCRGAALQTPYVMEASWG